MDCGLKALKGLFEGCALMFHSVYVPQVAPPGQLDTQVPGGGPPEACASTGCGCHITEHARASTLKTEALRFKLNEREIVFIFFFAPVSWNSYLLAFRTGLQNTPVALAGSEDHIEADGHQPPC